MIPFHEIDKSWSLFLDRDGVINYNLENDYVKNLRELKLIPGALEAIAACSSVFGRIFIVTNQQGIGKKLMTEKDLEIIHQYILQLIKATGGKVDKIYHCPAMDSENHTWRKPSTGMAVQAKKDFPEINLAKSIMVGDSISDLEFGISAGMFTVFISESEKKIKQADWVCRDLEEFAGMVDS